MAGEGSSKGPTMKTLKQISQRALWSITGTPGQRYARELAADLAKASRAQQCKVFRVSVFATDAEFEEARKAWLASLSFMSAVMDEIGATTPEGAIAAYRVIRERADLADAMQAEIDAIKAEMAAKKGMNSSANAD